MNIVGILQILRMEFRKFRILEILNFHPCAYAIGSKITKESSMHGIIMGFEKKKKNLIVMEISWNFL